MKTFTEYLNEVMLTFNKRTHPKFGQIVILSGGAGSGKGFIKSNLLGVDGIVFDVDRMKQLITNNIKLSNIVKEEYGKDIYKLDMTKAENVSFLHKVVSNMGINDKKMQAVLLSIRSAHPDRKPNIIFDVTLKDMVKFMNLTTEFIDIGYKKEDISVVWVLNTIDVARAQNKREDRGRVVPDDILAATHDGASFTMSRIINLGSKLKKYMDGEIYLAFNTAKVDNTLVVSDLENKSVVFDKSPSEKGQYIKDANYFVLKERGKAPNKDKIDKEIINKIKRYVPNSDVWDN